MRRGDVFNHGVQLFHSLLRERKMTDPVSYKQLIEALDAKFAEHQSDHRRIAKILDKYDVSINGSNGHPGLKGRVQDVETTQKNTKTFLGSLTPLLGIAAAWLGLRGH